jgi:hypothetical protein
VGAKSVKQAYAMPQQKKKGSLTKSDLSVKCFVRGIRGPLIINVGAAFLFITPYILLVGILSNYESKGLNSSSRVECS